MKIRVLHGVTGAAGQPRIVSKELKKIGVEADNILVGDVKFGYEADIFISKNDGDFYDFLKENIDKYDIYHFYYRSFFYTNSKTYEFPTMMDLLLLKSFNKKIVFHYRGSEIRYASKFQEFSPYNYVKQNPNKLFTKFPEKTVLRAKDFVFGVADIVMVPDPELNSYIENKAKIVQRAINMEEWPYIGVEHETRPIVVHAPSRQGVKGTSYVLKAVEELKKEGIDFEFILVENLPNHEAKEVYKKADIIIDQLRIGWYGVLAVECMSLGKPVISYIRDDLLHHFDSEKMPILNANPTNIKDILKNVVLDYELRKIISKNAREYCENTHDVKKIAIELKEIYSNLLVENKKPDAKKVIDFIQYQHNLYNKQKNTVVSVQNSTKSKIESYQEILENEGFFKANKRVVKKLVKMILGKK